MEARSTGSPSKHLVGSGIDKTLIVSCEGSIEDNVASEMNNRILAVETTLQELGCQFIKYQDNVTRILVQECSRLTQQMQDQIQKMIHDQVQSALSGACGDMFIELRAEMTRLLDSSSTPMIQCRDNTSACEGLDAIVKLRKFMGEIRKEIHEVHSILEARADATEKRLEEFESGISPRRKEFRHLTENAQVSAPLLEQISALSQDASTRLSSSGEPSPMPVSSVRRQINKFIHQQMPQPAPIPRIDLKTALEELRTTTSALNMQRLHDSTDLLNGCSDTLSVAGNVRMISAPMTFGYKMPGSCRVPVAGVESDKRPRSIQLRTRDGHMSLSVPQSGAPSRAAPQPASPPVVYRSPVPVWDAASVLPLV